MTIGRVRRAPFAAATPIMSTLEFIAAALQTVAVITPMLRSRYIRLDYATPNAQPQMQLKHPYPSNPMLSTHKCYR